MYSVTRVQREQVLKLRLAGHSYNEIQTRLQIAKSTVAYWMKNVQLSEKAKARLAIRSRSGVINGLIRRNKMQTHIARQRAVLIRNTAKSEIQDISDRELQIIGTALYWAEGYKRLKVKDGQERTGHAISFVNADPDMVRIFIKFLIRIVKVPKERLRLAMRLYDHMNEDSARAHWMRITGLSRDSFRKTLRLVSISSQRKKPFNTLPYGTLQIEVGDTEKFHKIMGWIEGMKCVS